MEDLTKKIACGNMAGFSKLWICPINEAQSVDYENNKKKTVTLTNTGRWALIEADGIELSNPYDDGYYILNLSCNYSGIRNEADRILDKMTKQMFLVKLKDRNGQKWLLGDINEPLHFRYEHVGNATGAGAHTYHLFFYRNTTEPLFLTD